MDYCLSVIVQTGEGISWSIMSRTGVVSVQAKPGTLRVEKKDIAKLEHN